MRLAQSLVVDASVAVKWLVDEPGSDAVHALKGRDLAAPALLRIEVANVMRTLVVPGARFGPLDKGTIGAIHDAPGRIRNFR